MKHITDTPFALHKLHPMNCVRIANDETIVIYKNCNATKM